MKRFSVVFLIFFTCACELIVDVKVPFDGEQLVVNSFVNPDSLWSATISLNRFILADDNLPYQRVQNATVTIHDENGVVATLQHLDDGKYRSLTEKPQAGNQYIIHVSAPNYTAVEASTIVPIPATITSVETENTISDDEPVVILKVNFTDNGDTKDFYHIRLEAISEYLQFNTSTISERTYPIDVSIDNPDLNSQFISADAGLLVKDVLFNGEPTEVRMKLRSYDIYAPTGFRLVLRSVSEDYYNYYATKELQNENSGNPFAQPLNVYNNITNGFGIFAGISSSKFEYYNPQPVIAEIMPSTGKVGDIIAINGQNLGSNLEYQYIQLAFSSPKGYISASIIESSDTQLKVVVPLGATSGKLLVGRDGNLTISDIEFQVAN